MCFSSLPFLSGQRLLENMLPQHVAHSLVSQQALQEKSFAKHGQGSSPLAAVCGTSVDCHEALRPTLISSSHEDSAAHVSPQDSVQRNCLTARSNQEQRPSSRRASTVVHAVAACSGSIAYKQWHPAVSVLFAVR
jgi:hypothetical protein